eukprot:gb/GEZN01004513.1/.p1 GENE.gb/GEZN01004513.1/~~gb/GEZN01004513.1/.p1  ORF type:complete len:500 (-),score=100.79 gb/GEZN01004513.1/:453-1919(-)
MTVDNLSRASSPNAKMHLSRVGSPDANLHRGTQSETNTPDKNTAPKRSRLYVAAIKDYERRRSAAQRLALMDTMKQQESQREITARRKRQEAILRASKKSNQDEQLRLRYLAEEHDRLRRLKIRKAVEMKTSPARERQHKNQDLMDRALARKARDKARAEAKLEEMAAKNEERRNAAARKAVEIKVTPTKVQALERELVFESVRRRKAVIDSEEAITKVGGHLAAEFRRQSVQARKDVQKILARRNALDKAREERELLQAKQLSLQDIQDKKSFQAWQKQRTIMRQNMQRKHMGCLPGWGTPTGATPIKNCIEDQRVADGVFRLELWDEQMRMKNLMDRRDQERRRREIQQETQRKVFIHLRKKKIDDISRQEKEAMWLEAEHCRTIACGRVEDTRSSILTRLRREENETLHTVKKLMFEDMEAERVGIIEAKKNMFEESARRTLAEKEKAKKEMYLSAMAKIKPLKRQIDFNESTPEDFIPGIPSDF